MTNATNTATLTGLAALEAKRADSSVVLNVYANEVDANGQQNVSLSQAEDIAAEDASLLFVAANA
jgi:hypothetical protein